MPPGMQLQQHQKTPEPLNANCNNNEALQTDDVVHSG